MANVMPKKIRPMSIEKEIAHNPAIREKILRIIERNARAGYLA
jgi:hypothetical protein